MKIARALLGLLLIAGSASAAQQDKIIAEITTLKGQVLIEDMIGKRTVANTKTKLMEGDSLIMLEKAEIGLRYVTSQCKMTHRGNALLTISEDAQCVPAQEIGVGFAPGTVNSFTATGQSFGTQGSTSFSNAGTSFFAGSTWAWVPIGVATTAIIVITADNGPVSP